MNKWLPLGLMGLLFSCSSDKQTSQNLDQQYIHKYGVELTSSEWDEYGQTGKIIHQTSDGITVTSSYVNGILHGDMTFTYPNSEAIYEIKQYDNGKIVFAKTLDPRGLPYQSVEYLFDGSEKHISYSKLGYPYLNELYHGSTLVSGKYYKADGSLESEVREMQGQRTLRNFEGTLEEKQQVENGSVVFSTSFYPSGFPKSHTHYLGGKIHGIRKTFLENGQPLTIETWGYDQLNGKTTIFENGIKSSIVHYFQGKKDGLEVFYDELGESVVQEVSWKHGLRHGPSYYYAENEEPLTEWYWENEPVSKFSFDEKMAN